MCLLIHLFFTLSQKEEELTQLPILEVFGCKPNTKITLN
jgi:hypothetical protein